MRTTLRIALVGLTASLALSGCSVSIGDKPAQPQPAPSQAAAPTQAPSDSPTDSPSDSPSGSPSDSPSETPSSEPTSSTAPGKVNSESLVNEISRLIREENNGTDGGVSCPDNSLDARVGATTQCTVAWPGEAENRVYEIEVTRVEGKDVYFKTRRIS